MFGVGQRRENASVRAVDLAIHVDFAFKAVTEAHKESEAGKGFHRLDDPRKIAGSQGEGFDAWASGLFAYRFLVFFRIAE